MSSLDLRYGLELDREHIRRFLEHSLDVVSLSVLERALELELFGAPVGLFLSELRERCRTSEPDDLAFDRLVELAMELGFVERHARVWTPTRLVTDFLAPNARVPLHGLVERHASYLVGLGHLRTALRSLPRSDNRFWSTRTSKEEAEHFYSSRHSYDEASRRYFVDTAVLLVRAHEPGAELSDITTVCDVGAGPAVFACLLQELHPHLRLHALDPDYRFPAYRQQTESTLRERGRSVSLLGLDALREALPEQIDLLTMNRVISGASAEDVGDWISLAARSLRSGAQVAIVDFLATGDPSHDALVAKLYMLRAGRAGALRAQSEERPLFRRGWGWSPPHGTALVSRLLEDAGFHHVEVTLADPPLSRVRARKK